MHRFFISGLLMRVLGFLFILLPALAFSQPVLTERAQLKKVLHENHIRPRIIDDNFSKDVFKTLIAELDPDCIYFTSADILSLAEFETRIDDEFNQNEWKFTARLVMKYSAALKLAEESINQICSKPFDFKKLALNDSSWAPDASRLRIKLENDLVLTAWEELTRGSLNSTLTQSEYFKKNEPEIRARIKQRSIRDVKRRLNAQEGLERYIINSFFRACAEVYDPHTAYLSPTQMQNFIASLSTQGYYIGFSVVENEQGDIVISALHPGGPAWKSGAFNVGDIVEKFRWANDEWTVLAGMTREEVGALLDESNEKLMEFSLRKVSGIVQTVTLRKEKFDPQYNVVRGYVLAGRKKIGYINLPDFYSDWDEADGAKCANDVAKEIIKLKNEQVQGIILDLRFNGGGSLEEAVAMAGIFIDAGPVGIGLSKGKEAVTLKDVNRGTVWDGPLVIMVNGFSASASEFLAAALQDYHRAIIVGSQTFGKGIGQELFSLETGEHMDSSPINASRQMGFCSITTSRMYRINGRSVQGTGVKPDIQVIQAGDVLAETERDKPFAIQADSILKKTYPQLLPLLPLAELERKSQERTHANEDFIAVDTYRVSMKQLMDDAESADANRYMTTFKTCAQQSKSLDTRLSNVKNNFAVDLHEYGRIDRNDYKTEINDAWLKLLSQDITLEETYQVICDYIDTLHRK